MTRERFFAPLKYARRLFADRGLYGVEPRPGTPSAGVEAPELDREREPEPEPGRCNEEEEAEERLKGSRDVSSVMHVGGGGGKDGIGAEGDASRVCAKLGMVDMRGESAHGRVEDVRSCSSVGSTKLRAGRNAGFGEH